MTEPPTPSASPSRTSALLTAVVIAILGSHLVVPALIPPEGWGVATWMSMPVSIRAFLFVWGVSLTWAGAREKIDTVWSLREFTKKQCLSGLLLLFVAFILFKTKELWGNPDIAMEDATRLRVNLKHPLSCLWSGLITAVVRPFCSKEDFSTGVVVSSALSGVVFVIFANQFSRILFSESSIKRRVVFWHLLLLGATQQFFGTLENYSFSWAMQMGALTLLMKVAKPESQDGSSTPIPAFLQTSLSSMSYIPTIFLWPATLFAFLQERSQKRFRSPRPWLLAILVTILPIVLCVGVFHWFAVTGRGYTWRLQIAAFGGMDKSAWVPFNIENCPSAFFTFFSLEHLSARLNLAFLVTPAWPVLLAACWQMRSRAVDDTRKRQSRTLGVASACALSFFVLVHPDLGPTMDWMQTATGTLAPTLWMLVFVMSRCNEQESARFGTLLNGVALLHTVPWILGNSTIASNLLVNP